MIIRRLFFLFFTLILAIPSACDKKSEIDFDSGEAKSHPGLILTQEGVEEIRASLGKFPLFDRSLAKIQQEVDAEIELGVIVPEPKDYSGGYSHERHKRNFFILQKAGLLFQILQEEKYAQYIKEALFA